MNLIKKKINFLAIIGMMVAFGTFAFTTPKETINKDAQHWYLRVDENTYIEALNDEQTNCPDEGDIICALGFDSEQNEEDLSDASEGNAAEVIRKLEE